MIEILATLFSGTFFGAALYINLAQHPATIKVGGDFASKFFPPMYAKASTLQVFLALAGTILGVLAWLYSQEILWLIGALFLVSVVPITIFLIKPINDQLLYPTHELKSEEVMALLKQWNPKHWIRSIASFLSFICYLLALAQ